MQPRSLPLAIVAMLILAATPTHAAPAAPSDLDGSYDAATETVTLSWTWTGTLGAGDAFTIYIDGAQAATTTATTYEDDVSAWLGGVRTYQVSAVVEGQESQRTGPIVVNGYFDPEGCTPNGQGTIDPHNIPGPAPDDVVWACLRLGDPNAPHSLEATYDSPNQALTLSWSHAHPEAVTAYRVYADDALLRETTATTYTDDLSAWDGTPRSYHVAAVINGEEHDSSRLTVLASPDLPWPLNSTCDVFAASLYPHRPFVDYSLYPECLPLIP